MIKTARIVMVFQRTFEDIAPLTSVALLFNDWRLPLVAADGVARDIDPNLVGNLQRNAIAADLRDLPVDAAGRHDPVVLLQRVEKLLHLLLLTLGGQQDDEIEDPEDEHERDDLN